MPTADPSLEDWFEGTEGHIHYRRWDPTGAPTRIVLIIHGYAEHGGRYSHVADARSLSAFSRGLGGIP